VPFVYSQAFLSEGSHKLLHNSAMAGHLT